MPTTSFYQWNYPAGTQQGWYTNYANLVQDQDVTVRSVELYTRKSSQTVVVLSSVVGSQWLIASSTTVCSANDNFPVSFFPLGVARGNFTVPLSGSVVRFDFETTATPINGVMVGSICEIIQFWSLIAKGPTATNCVLIGATHSEWLGYYRVSGVRYPLKFTSMVSLAPGVYSVELQTRLHNRNATYVATMVTMSPIYDSVRLFATIEAV